MEMLFKQEWLRNSLTKTEPVKNKQTSLLRDKYIMTTIFMKLDLLEK